MRKIEFTKDHNGYKKGQTVNLEKKEADKLIKEGVAAAVTVQSVTVKPKMGQSKALGGAPAEQAVTAPHKAK